MLDATLSSPDSSIFYSSLKMRFISVLFRSSIDLKLMSDVPETGLIICGVRPSLVPFFENLIELVSLRPPSLPGSNLLLDSSTTRLWCFLMPEVLFAAAAVGLLPSVFYPSFSPAVPSVLPGASKTSMLCSNRPTLPDSRPLADLRYVSEVSSFCGSTARSFWCWLKSLRLKTIRPKS